MGEDSDSNFFNTVLVAFWGSCNFNCFGIFFFFRTKINRHRCKLRTFWRNLLFQILFRNFIQIKRRNIFSQFILWNFGFKKFVDFKVVARFVRLLDVEKKLFYSPGCRHILQTKTVNQILINVFLIKICHFGIVSFQRFFKPINIYRTQTVFQIHV